MPKRKQLQESPSDLIDSMHFLEGVSAKIHGLLDQAKIYRTVKTEFARSKRCAAALLLLTDQSSKLKLAETSLSLGKRKKTEKAAGPRLKGRKVDLQKSAILSKVVRDGETVQVRFCEVIKELFPLSVANLISKNANYKKMQTVLTPLRRDSEVTGAFVISSPQLSEQLIPSVERLAQHISTALALAQEYADRKRVEEELRSSREELRSLSGYLQSVREEERTHIARELHDQLGQALTAQKMDLSWLEEELPKDKKVLKKLRSMSTLSDKTIDTVQRICTELRPRSLDDLGLAAAIEWQAGEFEDRTGIECVASVDSEDIALDRELSTVIFRIFQEALTNVARHANAARVNVSLTGEGGRLQLEVRDNGRGITQKEISHPKSFGLIGMRERVHHWGGEFEVKGIKNKGTTVTVTIPLLEPIRRRLIYTPRLVGRDKETRRLTSLLDRASQGEGGLVLVRGEAGIGKTRWVTEFGQDLETRGGRVLLGGCHEDTRSIPYYPFREAFSRFLEVRKEEGLSAFQNLPDYSQWELARILPGLEGLKPSQFEPAKDHFRLFEAFRLFIQALAAPTKGSLVFILEDLHLSGDATLDLLHYLARNLRESTVLLCGTYRTEEAGESLQRFRDSLQKERLSETLALEPLSPQDVSTMVDLLYPGVETSQEFRDTLYQKTEGNPFFVEELVKLMSEEEVAEGLTEVKEVPQSVQAVLKRRVDSLDPDVREILSCAALVGEEFEFEVLRGALDRPEAEVIEAMEAGAQARILRESVAGEEERYRFVHALMADVLYSGIGKARRRLWHSQVGEALERVYAERLPEVNGRLTYHFELGENWDKAFDYALKAARQAKEAYSNQEAIQLYEKTREILLRLTRSASGGEEERIAIAHGLGDVYEITGDYEKAIQEYRLMEESGRRKGDEKVEGKALRKMGSVYGRKGSYDEALKYGEQSLAMTKEIGDKTGIAESLNNVGTVHLNKGSYEQALRYYEESLAMTREIGDKKRIAHSLNNIGAVHLMQGSYDQALRYHEAALAIRSEIRDKRGIGGSLVNIGLVHVNKGSYRQALRYYEEALAIKREIGDKREVGLSLNNIGVVHWRKGSYDEALRYLEESLVILRKIGDNSRIAGALNGIGWVHLNKGSYDEALGYYEEALAIQKEIGDQKGIAHSLESIGEDHLIKGSYDEALRYLEESVAMAKEIGDKRLVAYGLDRIGLVHCRKASYDEALTYCEDALAIRREIGDRRSIAESLLSEGGLRRRLGFLDEAVNLHKHALSLSQEIGDREAESLTLKELGLDMLRSGNLTNSVSKLKEALAIAIEIKNVGSQAEALRGLGETHVTLGESEEATEAIEKLLSIIERTNSKRHLLQTYLLKARCLSPSEDALPYADKALTLSKEMGSPESLWRAHQLLGRILKEKGDHLSVSDHYEKAKGIVESIASNLGEARVRGTYLNKPEHKELFKECQQLSRSGGKKVRKSQIPNPNI